MKNKICVWFLLLFIWLSFANAQVTTSGLSAAKSLGQPVYGLGFAAGWASGVGISFRSHLPSKSSIQGVFGIMKPADRLLMSIGCEYQYDLVRDNKTRFYVGSAIAYFYNGSGSNETSAPFRIGAGAGGEFQVKDALHVSVGAMFVFFSDGRVIPLPQIAAHYYFF